MLGLFKPFNSREVRFLCFCQNDFEVEYKYQRIRDLSEDNDKTQAQITELLNEHTTQYQRWERGESEISAHIKKALCIYYNVSADYILGLPENLPFPKGSKG